MLKTKNAKSKRNAVKSKCGLCGKIRNLTKSECCDNWICDDEHKYVMFSYTRNSCHRNHSRYTLCVHHHNEGHSGEWAKCAKCRNDFETEMYVWYGTNEYNFAKLPNPPAYEPTKCAGCGIIIKLGEDGFSKAGKQYFCEPCSDERLNDRTRHSGDLKH